MSNLRIYSVYRINDIFFNESMIVEKHGLLTHMYIAWMLEIPLKKCNAVKPKMGYGAKCGRRYRPKNVLFGAKW